MTHECLLCKGKILFALGMNGVRYALDREAVPDGAFTISGGRAVPYRDDGTISPNAKRYQRHKCQRGKK